MAVVQQLLWSTHYPKSVVVPDAVDLLNLNSTHKPLKPPLRHTFIHSTFTFNITIFFFLLLLRLYSFVSNNV
jgi:hypothetical protein